MRLLQPAPHQAYPTVLLSLRLYSLWQEAHLRLEVEAAEDLSEEAIVSRLMQARYLVITPY